MSRIHQGHLAMLLFSALIAGSFSLGALSANALEPAALNAARFMLAGILIGALVIWRGALRLAYFRATWRYALLGGLFAIYFVMMFEGLKTADPVSMAAVFTLTPILSAGFGWLLLRQITTWRIASALLIGGSGAIWVIFRAEIADLIAFRVGFGEMIYFVGCVAHAIYTPLVKKLNRGEPVVAFTFGMLVAGLIILIAWSADEMLATDWTALPPIVWITIVYTAVFASAATFLLLQFAALRLPASKVMAYTYLTPSWVILWEMALGNPAPRVLVLVGVAMTVLALLMLLRQEPSESS